MSPKRCAARRCRGACRPSRPAASVAHARGPPGLPGHALDRDEVVARLASPHRDVEDHLAVRPAPHDVRALELDRQRPHLVAHAEIDVVPVSPRVARAIPEETDVLARGGERRLAPLAQRGRVVDLEREGRSAVGTGCSRPMPSIALQRGGSAVLAQLAIGLAANRAPARGVLHLARGAVRCATPSKLAPPPPPSSMLTSHRHRRRRRRR